ncbi:DNA polymerase V [Streptococcus loxodontisalivarius]|uniref:DNA polymerase V n=1 Tax=Streptococcus loxodontisalivarius TaxID=1349415 RepID=A0ABS2PTG1_9STRE|nr:DNA polymerase V [Streptococcus loxodontisalivarius]
MEAYIEENIKIQSIFQNYASSEDILPYSIDEAFLDLTGSLNYFYPQKDLDRKEKLDRLSRDIQKEIWSETGIYSTVGMSNANPLLAKLALDIEAKHTKTMRANWSYEDVESKVWAIRRLTDFWGIGRRTAKRLNKLGIFSIKQLAQANPDRLKKEFGVIGVQLWFHANGVDESDVHDPFHPQSHGIGNSQILPKDYERQEDIELVLREMAEQVAIRLRRRHKKAACIGLYVGFSKKEKRKSIACQKKIEPSQLTRVLSDHVITLFRQKYQAGAVRQIAIRYDNLVDDVYQSFSLFDDTEKIEKQEKLESTVDRIREKFGFVSLQKGSSLLENSRSVARSKLVGGHSAGGLDGLK